MYKKMFFSVVAMVAFATVRSAPRMDSLDNDLQDFMEIIPLEKIKKIAIQHLHDDPEFQAAVQYMHTPEWVDLVMGLFATPEVQELKKFLEDAGLNLQIFGDLCKFLKDAKVETDHPTRSFKSFLDDVKKIMPIAKLIDTMDYKLNNSPHFQEFYAKISSDTSHMLVSKVRALPEFKKFAGELAEMGFNLERILKVIYAFFGWNNGKYEV